MSPTKVVVDSNSHSFLKQALSLENSIASSVNSSASSRKPKQGTHKEGPVCSSISSSEDETKHTTQTQPSTQIHFSSETQSLTLFTTNCNALKPDTASIVLDDTLSEVKKTILPPDQLRDNYSWEQKLIDYKTSALKFLKE